MSSKLKKISDSVKWEIVWSKSLPLNEPELEPLLNAGFFVAGIAEVSGPIVFRSGGGTTTIDETLYGSTTYWIPLEGRAQVKEENGKITTIAPGNLCLRPLYIRHNTRVMDASFLHVFLRNKNASLAEIRNIDFPDYRFVAELLERIYRESLVMNSNHSNIVRNLSATLASLLERAVCFEPDRIDAIFQYIVKNPKVLWTTAKLAHKLNVSESLLYKLCLKRYQKSPSRIIGEIKIRQANELLYNTDSQLESIAEQLGYSSAFAFSKAYFKLAGFRPGAIRKKFNSRNIN